MPTIDYGNTNIIDVPQSELTLVSGTTYTHDIDAFRLALKDIEDGDIGMVFPRTHSHNTEVLLSGVTYARSVQILLPYSVRYEDTGAAYTVSLIGANNNIADVLVPTPLVTLVTNNSAGLQTVGSGSVTAQQIRDAMELSSTDGQPPIDTKLNNSIAISAANL